MDTQTNGTVHETRDGGTVEPSFRLYPYSLKQLGVCLPTLDELSSVLKVWKEKYAVIKGDTQMVSIIENSSDGTSPMDAEMDDDSSLEETYFRVPKPLASSVADVCSMETSEKVVHIIFNLYKIKNQNIAGVKVDVNFNCPGEKRKRHATLVVTDRGKD